VTVPLSATDGQFDLATVSLVSQGDQSETTSAAITTYAGQLYALTLDPAGINKFGNPGGQVQYTVEVTNTGYLADAFSVSTIGVNWPTVVVPTRVPSAGSLSPGQKGQFTVTVQVPASNPGRTRDLVILIVTSLAHPSTWKQSFITTILTGEDSLFLPGMFH
jgi:hypothetical protein